MVVITRNPIRSETDAFRMTIAVAGLIVVAVVTGSLTEPLIGLIVFFALAAIAVAAYLNIPERGRRLPLREAAGEPHPHAAPPGRRHVLVIANEPLEGAELEECIRGLAGTQVEVDVLAPVMSTRAHLLYTDIDKELAQAYKRLARSLAWAREQGFVARGEVGDPSPTTAIEDELRDFGADEVIVLTSNQAEDRWQERAELERLRDELEVPVTQVPIG